MGKKRKFIDKEFDRSAILNSSAYWIWYNKLMSLAISMFEWKNLPDSIDPRFVEYALYMNGCALYFNDEVMGNLCLQTTIAGRYDVYNVPNVRIAYANNGYRKECTDKDSVVIFNNYTRTTLHSEMEMYAYRLAEIDRTIDVNVKAQKIPVMVLCEENQRLVLENLMQKWSGNIPFIFGTKNLLDAEIKGLNLEIPFVSADLQILKRQIFNEALTVLGIENSNTEKKERMVTDEVVSNLGVVEAQRIVRLNARRDACKKINEMFGTNIDVVFRNSAYNAELDDEEKKDAFEDEENIDVEGEENE